MANDHITCFVESETRAWDKDISLILSLYGVKKGDRSGINNVNFNIMLINENGTNLLHGFFQASTGEDSNFWRRVLGATAQENCQNKGGDKEEEREAHTFP